MSKIQVDETHWPLVVTRWPVGEISDSDCEEYLRLSLQLSARQQRHVVLHEAVAETSLSAKQRRTMGDHIKQHKEALKAHVAGAAIVSSSMAIRGLITAINWVSPPPFPQKVFKSRNEAETWLRSLL